MRKRGPAWRRSYPCGGARGLARLRRSTLLRSEYSGEFDVDLIRWSAEAWFGQLGRRGGIVCWLLTGMRAWWDMRGRCGFVQAGGMTRR